MSVCDHCQYCSYCRGDVDRLRNAIKELSEENDKLNLLNFDLTKSVLDAKNAKHFIEQERKSLREKLKKLEDEIRRLKIYEPCSDPDPFQDHD